MAKTKSQDKSRKGLPALDKSPSHLLHRALQLALDIYAEELGAGASLDALVRAALKKAAK